jgi:hypothetical protein
MRNACGHIFWLNTKQAIGVSGFQGNGDRTRLRSKIEGEPMNFIQKLDT